MFRGINLTLMLRCGARPIWENKKKITQGNTTHKRAKRSALSQQVTTRLQATYKTAYQIQT